MAHGPMLPSKHWKSRRKFTALKPCVPTSGILSPTTRFKPDLQAEKHPEPKFRAMFPNIADAQQKNLEILTK